MKLTAEGAGIWEDSEPDSEPTTKLISRKPQPTTHGATKAALPEAEREDKEAISEMMSCSRRDTAAQSPRAGWSHTMPVIPAIRHGNVEY